MQRTNSSRIHDATSYHPCLKGVLAISTTSNHHFPRHSHEQFGIGLITDGAQRSWTGSGLVESSAGDIVLLNPGEIHDGIPVACEYRTWQMLYLDPWVVHTTLSEDSPGSLELAHPVVRDGALLGIFQCLFSRLTTLSGDSLAAEEYLVRLLMLIARLHGTGRPALARLTPSVVLARHHIDAAPEAPTSLAELAALSGTSRYQLLRAFAREVGMTPHAYRLQQRVRMAQRLLAAGKSPGEAAQAAGFTDQSHLTHAFLRQVGLTPGRYRAAVL